MIIIGFSKWKIKCDSINYNCKIKCIALCYLYAQFHLNSSSNITWKLVPRLVKKFVSVLKSYLHRFTTLLYNTLGYDFRYIKHVIVVLLFIPKTRLFWPLKWKSKCFSASWVQLQSKVFFGKWDFLFSILFPKLARSSIGGLLHKPEMTSEWHR